MGIWGHEICSYGFQAGFCNQDQHSSCLLWPSFLAHGYCLHLVSSWGLPPWPVSGYLPVRTIGYTELRLTSVDLLSYLFKDLVTGHISGDWFGFSHANLRAIIQL